MCGVNWFLWHTLKCIITIWLVLFRALLVIYRACQAVLFLTVPSSLGDICGLEQLTIHYASVSGSVLSTLCKLTKMKNVSQWWKANLLKVRYFAMSDNYLHGEFPATFSGLVNMQKPRRKFAQCNYTLINWNSWSNEYPYVECQPAHWKSSIQYWKLTLLYVEYNFLTGSLSLLLAIYIS